MKFSIPEDIIIPFNQGDQEVFARIYQELYPFIFSYTRRLADSSAAAQDIVSDSFIKLWKNRGGFENLAKVKSFVFQTARNACLDYLKHARLEREKAVLLSKQLEEPAENLLEAAERRAELLDLIYREIERLPRQRRLIFQLYYLSGLTNTEIAARLGISEKSVSNQKTLAMKTLKLKLNKMKAVSMPILLAATHFGTILHHFRSGW